MVDTNFTSNTHGEILRSFVCMFSFYLFFPFASRCALVASPKKLLQLTSLLIVELLLQSSSCSGMTFMKANDHTDHCAYSSYVMFDFRIFTYCNQGNVWLLLTNHMTSQSYRPVRRDWLDSSLAHDSSYFWVQLSLSTSRTWCESSSHFCVVSVPKSIKTMFVIRHLTAVSMVTACLLWLAPNHCATLAVIRIFG